MEGWATCPKEYPSTFLLGWLVSCFLISANIIDTSHFVPFPFENFSLFLHVRDCTRIYVLHALLLLLIHHSRMSANSSQLLIFGQVMLFSDESTILSHDLYLLESVEFKLRVKHLVEIVEEVKWQDIDPDMLTRSAVFLCLPIVFSSSSSFPSINLIDFFFWFYFFIFS